MADLLSSTPSAPRQKYRRVVTLDDSSTTDQLESSECEVRSNSFLSDDRSVEETESSQGSSHNTSEHDSDSDSFVVDDDEYLTDDASFSLASYSEVSSSVTDLSNKEPIRRTQRLRFAKIDLDTGMIDHIDETNSPTTEEPSLVSEHDVATVDNSSDDEGPEEQQNPNSSRKIGEEKVESVKASTSSESDEDDDESFERYLKKLRTGSSREERTEVKENIVHEKRLVVNDFSNTCPRICQPQDSVESRHIHNVCNPFQLHFFVRKLLHKFEFKLPEFLDVKWNPRLRKTAGMCRNKPDRTSWIELSPKVCSAPDRVRDTLIHEMCHAAVWIVDGRVKEGHGPVWKKWVGRHTKSLDIVRKICGICKGRFTLQVRQNARKTTTKEGLEHNPFAKFVKENYGKHKKPGVKHGEVMRLLSQLYKEHSTPKTTGVEAELPKELDISVLSIHE
ncbi:hypothetical protein ANCCEY_07590 [Ancylostoma ceylanicum]|uniref:SprT-like domain-containing protein n=1 Tax=Ancylostoma ceylanicum TaxID=53326 RepID=A0A0D6LND9_9BILA|nr:hypothetical protein ANCCEY_07590 [Ancylostoma ceylanicum]